jgi:beta-fructofuranosidase
MRRRKFIESLGATTLLAGAVPVWGVKPWSGSSQSPEARVRGETRDREFFYRPEDAWAADFIPFYEDGKFHLFYLHDWRDIPGHGEGTPWYQISTDDFVHFVEHGQMLARGTEDEQDLYVFTGSVIKAEGRYHIFYTGHNPYFRKQGKPEQGVMHAVSDELLNWRKLPEDAVYAPQASYEPHDWRDPFVFWNDEAKEYWMLLAARLRTGPARRRGCTALCASKDLRKWEVREPFWTPGLYFTHECPDLFRMGNWWYLIYSEFTERTETHYRMSRSLKGPWLAPDNDTFDGRAFYAAKTASDGYRRFVFGWIPSRDDRKDYRPWNWGGNLVVHELVQESDGTLSVKVPASVDQAFHEKVPYEFQPGVGPCKISQGIVQLTAPGSFGCSTAGSLPSRCKIAATVDFEENTRGCGLMLRARDNFDSGYFIRLEPARDRLVFDSWPRPGDVPFWVELERPMRLEPQRPVDLKVFVDGTVCVVYAANKIAMSTRLYDLKQGGWGVFVNEGSVRFRNVQISV